MRAVLVDSCSQYSICSGLVASRDCERENQRLQMHTSWQSGIQHRTSGGYDSSLWALQHLFICLFDTVVSTLYTVVSSKIALYKNLHDRPSVCCWEATTAGLSITKFARPHSSKTQVLRVQSCTVTEQKRLLLLTCSKRSNSRPSLSTCRWHRYQSCHLVSLR